MQLKQYLLCTILFFLVGCHNKQEVLFENIYIGDNLKECITKGAVVQNISNQEYTFELGTNNIANSYFDKSEVKFNGNNEVEEISLEYHYKKKGKTAQEVFNFMTQYFCQRYTDMRTEKLNKAWEIHGLSWQKEGMQNIWETNKIKMTLSFYTNKPIYDESEHVGNPYNYGAQIANDLVRKTYAGQWVKLQIVTK